jgi:CO dehydrogenase/acetyl-CoA synthase delta subunit
MSETMLGNKNALGNQSRKGQPHSTVSKAKMSQAKLGNKNALGNYQKPANQPTAITGDIFDNLNDKNITIYPSIKQAAKSIFVDPGNLTRMFQKYGDSFTFRNYEMRIHKK